MYCPNCGAENITGAELCANCGVSLLNNKRPNYTPDVEDRPNLGINLLSLCCIPILGVIMYFVWKDQKPAAAKSALIFGLCGIALVGVVCVISFILGFLFYIPV